MNQAPPPPTPEQIAADLDRQIQASSEQIAGLDESVAQDRQAAIAAEREASVAAMRRSEAGAHAAALGVNAVVDAQRAIAGTIRKFSSTNAQAYDVNHPEAERQRENFASMVGTQVTNAKGEQVHSPSARRSQWKAANDFRDPSRIGHRQHEENRARALGMDHENHYPWHSVERRMDGVRRFFTEGPKRLRRVDPHEKQLETDYHHRDHDVHHGDGLTRSAYLGATSGISRGARWLFRRPNPTAPHHDHETATVADAFALTADRIGQQVRHSTTGEPLPARVAHRDTLGWPGALHDGQTQHISIPEIANREVRRLQAELAETNRLRAANHQPTLRFRDVYGFDPMPARRHGHAPHEAADVVAERNAGLNVRLGAEETALVDTGRHMYQLSFGEQDPTEIARLRAEHTANETLVEDLSRPDVNTIPGIDLEPYEDTLLAADSITLRELANIRQQQREVTARLQGTPATDPLHAVLIDELRTLDGEYRHYNGGNLTDAQDALRNLQSARRAMTAVEDAERRGHHDTAARQRAEDALDDAEGYVRTHGGEDTLRDTVAAVIDRRNEIVELESRNRQIEIILNGGMRHDPAIARDIPADRPNQANRADVLDYFTDVAQRQIDVAASRAAIQAQLPENAHDQLAIQANQLQRDYEAGMLLMHPTEPLAVDSPDIIRFIGRDTYDAIVVAADKAAAAGNGKADRIRQTVLAQGVQRAIAARVRQIQEQQNTVNGQIRERATAHDALLPGERIILPRLMGAVAARPNVMRQGVLAEEEVMENRTEERDARNNRADRNAREADAERRRLAQLQRRRRAVPVP